MAPPTLATSLVPNPTRRIVGGREIGHLNQHRCIESWRASGFQVLSVNAADEAEAVRAAYPDVPIIAAERDARSVCGRPVIPVSEMIRALQTAGVTWGGITSADLRVADPTSLRSIADEALEAGRAVLLSRANIAHPCDDAGSLDPNGPAAVLFDVGLAARLNIEPFAVGLPGWGRALAIALLVANSQAICPAGAALLHLDHPRLAGEDLDWSFFEAFRTRFSSELELLKSKDDVDVSASLAAVADLGRHARTYADLATRRADRCGTDESARRHMGAFAAAVADLIRDLATPRPEIVRRA
ncbi:hypothetical protein [Methylobacterium sp. E-066]|uniref:hypothetical protein n=1 Tax=Methylobacterium sp. E-066 TaxID=2836584 RepID=UPI001FB8E6EE|nr:hypothetical protein [Methylobacterium sp. E-066]MCJ2142955.1 hypothetical protein [Methylobacterium sp. E-066]